MSSEAGRRAAVVTGGGSGIGRAATLALVEAGWAVAIAGRRTEPLQKVAAEAAGRVLPVPTDVTDPAGVRALFDATKEGFGRVDLLFNNAGTAAPAVEMDELDVEDWTSVVDVNLTGTFLCTREAFRVMKAQTPPGGRVINNGSVSAYVPRPLSAPYTATKHAITGLTRQTALDGRKHDIACGQIDIGNAETEMTREMAEGTLQAHGGTAPEPLMDVQHVADAVVHMAGLPLDANVLFMTVMATGMPYVGRG